MNVRTREHGRFYIGPNGHRRFAGSASGVYLADTIRHKLASHPQRDGGVMEAFISQLEGLPPAREEQLSYTPYLLTAGDFSDEAELRSRFNTYFANWHPLFPFLDGAYLQGVFKRCAGNARAGVAVFEGMGGEHALVLSAIFRSIFTIGGTGRAGPGIPIFTDSTSASTLAMVILGACESNRLDHISTVQALFAIELSLYFARRFRPASHLSGLINKLVFEAGLHRCPCRYPTTFDLPSERDLRKRLFYSIYVLDRFLTRHLGAPITLRDIDIDVCLPGAAEIHGEPPSSVGSTDPAATKSTKRKRDKEREDETTPASPMPVHPSNPQTHDGAPLGTAQTPTTPFSESQTRASAVNKLMPAFSLAQLAGIMGRIMETFNGSRRWRAADAEDAMRIRTELEEWWLDFELDMQDVTQIQTTDSRGRYTALFRSLYNQNLMHINRHSLSLPPESIPHRNALQAIILAARTICSSLSIELGPYPGSAGPSSASGSGGARGVGPAGIGLVWPGYVDMVFDAGLALMYGTKVSAKLADDRAAAGIRQAVLVMDRLSEVWDGLQPVVMVIREFNKRLDPHRIASGTGDTPDLSLDWLIGTDFNLEANPSGPEYMFLPGFGAGLGGNSGIGPGSTGLGGMPGGGGAGMSMPGGGVGGGGEFGGNADLLHSFNLYANGMWPGPMPNAQS